MKDIADKWKDCPVCKANVKLLSDYDDDYGKLKEENKKLRECVEFYADKKNWTSCTRMPKYREHLMVYISDLDIIQSKKEGRRRARQCLKELKG